MKNFFMRTLKYGKEGEKFATTLFKDYDELCEAPFKKFSLWDFYVRYGDKKIFYEVKRDAYTSTTGNICIEFESNGVLSGISITEADYYIYLVEGESNYYNIPVQVIKDMIKDGKYHQTRKVGYKFLSNCYFFNRALFEPYKQTIVA